MAELIEWCIEVKDRMGPGGTPKTLREAEGLLKKHLEHQKEIGSRSNEIEEMEKAGKQLIADLSLIFREHVKQVLRDLAKVFLDTLPLSVAMSNTYNL